MLTYLITQAKRKPIPTLAVLLFVAVLSLSLCGLHFANRQAHENYEELYGTVPVSVTVTDLTGQRSTDLDAYQWVYNLFISDYELGGYLKDIRVKVTENIDSARLEEEAMDCNRLLGITSLESEPGFFQAGDMAIRWCEGYDASVIEGDGLVCIIPERFANASGQISPKVTVKLSHSYYTDGRPSQTFEYQCNLTVAGYHSLDSDVIYCPLGVMKTAYSRLGKLWTVDSISATVADNHKIDEMWESAADWFVKPNPTGAKTPWDYSWYSYYPYALKVDDGQLTAAAAALERSVRINDICTVGIFVLAAGASFLVGFLMIRSRKKEIILMRTMGTPAYGIFGSFALEQLLCVVLGVVLGGAAFLWRPLGQLLLFVVIYALGLTLALLVFLRKNLMATMKEDE